MKFLAEHNDYCRKFNVIACSDEQRVFGVCSKCGKVLEVYERHQIKAKRLRAENDEPEDLIGDPIFHVLN